MNIKRALKEKNKLVKQNSESFNRLSTYNSVEEEAERAYDPREALEEWRKGVDELVELKARIHRANTKVFEKIFKLAELKSMVKQLKHLDCTSGKISSYRREDTLTKTAVISVLERDALVKNLENEIEVLQEELDTHNSKAKI